MAPSRQAQTAGRPRVATRTPRDASAAVSYAISAGVRSRMQMQRTRDTAAEMAVRKALHAMGLRYRVDRSPLPGLRRRADIVFGPARVAVYIDGCFWHGCPDHGNRQPASNGRFWSAKIAGNRARDEDTDRRLAAAGWAVLRAWEHEPAPDVADRVAATVRARLPAAVSRPETRR
jgi:DNA mismatch endonuclease (patch repair protein)